MTDGMWQMSRPDLEARVAELEAQLKAMTEDRDLWADEHNGDCPNEIKCRELEAENKQLSEELETANANHRKMAAEMAALGEENKRLREFVEKIEKAYLPTQDWDGPIPRTEAKP